jgi:hypothetical protein
MLFLKYQAAANLLQPELSLPASLSDPYNKATALIKRHLVVDCHFYLA